MTIKLNGSTAGSVAIDAPASTTGNADIQFKLPVADGTAGQVLQTDGSGNLSWVTPSSGSMTLLATMSLANMSANTVSQSLNLTGYKDLKGYITGLNLNGGTLNDTWFTFNGNNSSGDYSWVRHYLDNSGDTSTNRVGSNTGYAYGSVGPGFSYNGAGFAGINADDNEAVFHLYNVNGGTKKTFSMLHTNFLTRNMVFNTTGRVNFTNAITSFDVNVYQASHRLTAGTIELYGVK